MSEKTDESNKRKVNGFEVYLNAKNHVVITQSEDLICVHPTQAKVLSRWITECATEAKKSNESE